MKHKQARARRNWPKHVAGFNERPHFNRRQRRAQWKDTWGLSINWLPKADISTKEEASA